MKYYLHEGHTLSKFMGIVMIFLKVNLISINLINSA